MILYLDTSALLKPHLSEPDSGHMRKVMHSGATAYTHLITYPEMRTALAQAVRMKRLSEADRTYQLRAFEADCASLHVVAITAGRVSTPNASGCEATPACTLQRQNGFSTRADDQPCSCLRPSTRTCVPGRKRSA